jgi:hypothetical protein
MGAPALIVFVAGDSGAEVLTHEGTTRQSARDAMRLDAFAAAVAAHTAAPVTVVDRLEPPDLDDGAVYVGDHSMVQRLLGEGHAAAHRIVELYLPQAGAAQYLEQAGLAAGVEMAAYVDWLGRPHGPGVSSLYGLRATAPALEATCTRPAGRYCLLRSARLPHLPELLAAYLAAYPGPA